MTTKKSKKQLEQENIQLKKQIEELKQQEKLQNTPVVDKKEYNSLIEIEDSKLNSKQQEEKNKFIKDLEKWERKTNKVKFVVLKKDEKIILLNTSTSYIDIGKMIGDKYLSIWRPLWRWPTLFICYCSLILAPIFYIELIKNNGEVNRVGTLSAINKHGYKPYSKDDAIRLYRLLPAESYSKDIFNEFGFENIKNEYHNQVKLNIETRKKELKKANNK